MDAMGNRTRSAALSRRKLLGGALAVTGSLAIGACTGSGEKPSKSSGPLKWIALRSADATDSHSHKYLQSEFDVKIELVTGVTGNEAASKLATLLAGGEKIDVLNMVNFGPLGQYASQGLFAEVPMELIKKHAPKVKEDLDKNAPAAWNYANYEGTNFGLPTSFYPGQFAKKSLWRADLLARAGINTVPQTIEDLTAAFAALKRIGVYGMNTLGNSDTFGFNTIFGAYGLMPMQWHVRDGKVVNDAVAPEVKDVLGLLAGWYKLGYIDPEFLAPGAGDTFTKRFVAGKFAMSDSGSVGADDLTNPSSLASAIKQADPQGRVVFGPAPKGPGGRNSWAWGTGGHVWAFGRHLQEDHDRLGRIMEIIEAGRMDDKTMQQINFGTEGTMWSPLDPAKGAAAGIKRISPYDDAKQIPKLLGIDSTAVPGVNVFVDEPGFPLTEKYTAKATQDALGNYSYPLMDVFGQPGFLKSAGRYWAGLQATKVREYSAIVRGDKPVSAFDDFVKVWNQQGGETLQREADEYYNKYVKGKLDQNTLHTSPEPPSEIPL